MRAKILTLLVLTLSCIYAKAQFQIISSKSFSSSIDYNCIVGFTEKGDKIVAGVVIDTVNLSSTVQLIQSAAINVYISAYNKKNQLKWYYLIKGVSSTGNISSLVGIKIDSKDNIYIAGNYKGEIAFSTTVTKSAGTLGNAFYLKLDSTGTFVQMGDYSNAYCADFDITSDNRVVIGGNTATNPRNALIAKFKSNGQIDMSDVIIFKGSKNNRDQLTALCIDNEDNIYFAGKCNGSDISLTGLSTTVKGPNNINYYTLFYGKITKNNQPSWLKGAVPIAGNRPYSFDITEMHYHNNHRALIMAGVFQGTNFSLDGDTLATTSTVNSDSRKPILLSLDSSGSFNFKTSLGLNLENQRGEIFTLSLSSRHYIISTELENYENPELHLAGLKIKRLEKSFGIIGVDSIGQIVTAIGTHPSDKIDVLQVNSAAYHTQSGYAVTLVQNSHPKVTFGPIDFSTGTTLLSFANCGSTILKITGNEKKCDGDSVKLEIKNSYNNIEWYENGVKLGLKGNEIYVTDSALIHATAYTTNGCALVSDSIEVSFYKKPKAIISGIKNKFCLDDDVVKPTLNPIGGTLKGKGISNNNFDAALAGVGKHALNYSVTDKNGCTAQTDFELEVFDLPIVKITDLDTNFCDNLADIGLTGFPSKGIFSGIGVKNNKLNPANGPAGARNILYTYTDENGCNNTDTQQIQILESTKIFLTGLDSVYCPDDTNITIRSNVSGGVFTGSGILDSIFNPKFAGEGKHFFTYTYTNDNGCESVVQLNTRVRSLEECGSNVESSDNLQMTIYPNPIVDELYIRNSTAQNAHLQMIQLDGKMVIDRMCDDQLTLINLRDLAKGVYLIKVKSQCCSISRQLIKY